MQGPRSKCDQVIFEFIAKTTEIIVTSRCQVSDVQSTDDTGNTSARFNFSFQPVEKVRSLLQPWKHSLHVPLRVDIFYSHYPSDKNTEERILLERWCIDYVSYHEVDEKHPNNNNDNNNNNSGQPVSTAMDNAEVITQLRQLCKKIMIALRTIYCKARILPAYQLHCYLTQGIPLGIHRSQERGKLLQQLQQHQLQPAIGYIFYAAPHHHDDAADSYLQRNQFQQDTFRELPTPYGSLRLSVWYHPQSNNIVLRQINSASSLQRTGPIQIPKHPKHNNSLDDAHYLPTSAPSSNESDVHDFLIPNYSPKPESLMIKRQQPQNQKSHQQLLQHDNVRKLQHHRSGSDGVQQLSSADRASNIKPSMSGLSLALLQNNAESQQRTSSSPDVIKDATATATTKNRHRSHSLTSPFSQTTGANTSSSSSRPIAKESASPSSSYQTEPSYIHTHRSSVTQAKSLSPRTGHLQKHLVSPNHSPGLQPVIANSNNSINRMSDVDHPPHGHGYGYGYNNPSTPNLTAASAIPISKPFQLRRNDSSETNRSGATLQPSSSPRYLSCSPAPFLLQTTSPGARSFRKSLLSRANSAGVGLNSDCPVSRPPSPPFVSHPMTWQQEVSSSEVHRNESQTNRAAADGESSTTASMLLPPSSLETLLKSPFKSNAGTLSSGTDNATPAMWSSMNSLVPHFVPLVPVSQNSNSIPFHDPSQLYQPSPSLVMGTNSAYMFGSTSNAGGYMLSLSINSRGSAAIDPTGAPSSPRFLSEEMPFVDTDLATVDQEEFSKGMDVPRLDFMSSSVVAASSLAHKCATAGRLSLFSQDNSTSRISEKGPSDMNRAAGASEVDNDEVPDSNNDKIAELDHLAEFRDFGVLMNTNLEKLSLR